MITITGGCNSAKIFTDTLESGVEGQISKLLDQPFAAGSQIRIMPDVHAGAGCAIGTTMTVTDKVAPNLVGGHRLRHGDGKADDITDRTAQAGQLYL